MWLCKWNYRCIYIVGVSTFRGFDKTILHPEEGVYDCVGGIDLGTVTSVLAADVIDSRVY